MKTARFLSLVFAFAVSATAFSCAQSTSDTVRLNDVRVVAKKTKSQNALVEDSLAALHFKSASLGVLLASFGGVAMRRYGPGGAATFAPRGYSPQQVAVIWNGVNVTNPMLGQTDLSLLPVFFFDNAALRLEPNTLDGAPAGAVRLNESFTNKGFHVTTQHTANTLYNFSNGLRLQTSSARWKTSLAVFDERNQNLFWYRNRALPGNPVNAHKHAESHGHGASFGTRYTAYENSLHVGGFVYRIDRALPPTMLQTQSRDTQDDANAAAFIRFEHRAKTNITADVTTALHRIEFFEGATNQTFVSNSSVIKSSFTAQRNFSFIDASVRAQSQLALAEVKPDVYNRNEWQHGLQLKLVKRFAPLGTSISAEGMQRMRDDEFVPFNYTLTASQDLSGFLRIELTHASLTRLPGLNDRFWIPGGNALLEPELALRNNAKLELKAGKNGFRFVAEVDAYYDRVDNWIQWVPTGVVWSPRNVKTVLLYGVSPHVSLQKKWSSHVSSFTIRYNYNRAVTERSFAANDASVGKQLMYVPTQTVHAHASHGFKKWSAFGSFNYTGTRFTSSDHMFWLHAYTTFDAGIARRFDVKSFSLSASALVENITDTVYQSVAWKPMPPRVFSLTLTLQYHHIPTS